MRRPHSDSLAAVCGEDRLKAVTSGDVICGDGSWICRPGMELNTNGAYRHLVTDCLAMDCLDTNGADHLPSYGLFRQTNI